LARIDYDTNVKLRHVPRALGLASSVPREYPYEIATFTLPIDGEVQLARWLHPNETPKVVTQEHVDALRAFLREGDVAIDIGAHTGDTSLPMALAVGRGGAVFALEPNPYVFKVLSATATLNPTKARIVPLMFAAMPNDGEFEFEYSDSGYCNGGFHHAINRWKHGHFSQLRVTGRNLADYLRKEAPAEVPRIRFVKIDTEGYDRIVVQSLASLIATVRPYIKTEIYRHLPAGERISYFDDLRQLGYRVFKCEEYAFRGEELGPADLSRWKHFDVFAVPRELL
jgi:FkbM family methyltransferase